MGILDNKTRIIDALVTNEGRRQLVAGNFQISSYAFTDQGCYYSADIASGTSDATKRFYLEPCNLPQDQVTFEANDAGFLMSMENTSGISVDSGKILSSSFSFVTSSTISDLNENVTVSKGDQFASTAGTLLASSLDNFKNLQLIATKDAIFEDDGFGVGNSNIIFTMSDGRPVSNDRLHVANINEVDSLFNDPRLNSADNFLFLPPINRVPQDQLTALSGDLSTFALGNYPSLGRNAPRLTYDDVNSELQQFENMGFMKIVRFDPTSRNNNLMIQCFEVNHDTLVKLDVIDYGTFRTGNSVSPQSHIFFIGKIFTDDNETHTFVHLFTAVFE